MDSPTVSVVITAYHRTRWLPAATSSVLLAQTDPPDEVLVVEEQGDGRRAYEETETRGVPVRRWNGAPAGESLERVGEMVAFGLREARSEIVSFLDDDDVYLPGKVAAVRGFFAAHPAASALKTYPLRIDAEGRLGGPLYPPPYRTERRVAPVLREALVSRVAVQFSTLSFRRRDFLDLADAISEVAVTTDNALYLLSQLHEPREYWALPLFLSAYRWHGSNVTDSPREIVESVPLWERFLRLATEDGATAFARRYAAFMLANRRSLRMQRRREPWSPAVSAAQAWENAKSLSTFMWANTAGHAWRGVMRTIGARADRR